MSFSFSGRFSPGTPCLSTGEVVCTLPPPPPAAADTAMETSDNKLGQNTTQSLWVQPV